MTAPSRRRPDGSVLAARPSWSEPRDFDGPSHVYVDEIAVVRRCSGDVTVPLTIAERRECVRRLHARGLHDRPIASVLGITDRTVLRIRQRLDLPAIPLNEGQTG